MATLLERIKTDAKALSFEEREQLIAHLLEDDDAPLSDEWVAEIERRVQEIADGAKTYPLEEVLAELRAELRQKEVGSH